MAPKVTFSVLCVAPTACVDEVPRGKNPFKSGVPLLPLHKSHPVGILFLSYHMMIKPAGTSGLLTPATVNEVTVKAHTFDKVLFTFNILSPTLSVPIPTFPPND
jgi:hypothetical protein